MGRSPCCSKEGLNRGAWTALEDKILTDYITLHGEGRWRNLPKRAGLKRCGKSCRLRWLNYLRPDIKRGNITPDEEELIIRLHKLLGNRWSLIAGRLPGRTDNEIKNYWNTNLGKRVKDPPHLSAAQSHQKKLPTNNDATTTTPSSGVVHTKATKCSKVIITNPILMYNNNNNNLNLNLNLKEDSSINNGNDEDGLVSAFEGGQGHHHDHHEHDLLMGEFDMADLCLSDLLNSDFSAEMCDFTTTYTNSDDISDHPFHFSDDILNLNLNHWTPTTKTLQS